MRRLLAAGVLAAGLVGCSRGDNRDTAVQDSLERDLARAPAASESASVGMGQEFGADTSRDSAARPSPAVIPRPSPSTERERAAPTSRTTSEGATVRRRRAHQDTATPPRDTTVDTSWTNRDLDTMTADTGVTDTLPSDTSAPESPDSLADSTLAPFGSDTARPDTSAESLPGAGAVATPDTTPSMASQATDTGDTSRPTASTRAGVTLSASSQIRASLQDSVSSRSSHAGEHLAATVTDGVRGSSGQVAVPAGSTVHLTITDIQPAKNRGDTGKLVITVDSLTVSGKSYPIVATVTSLESSTKGRGIGTSEAAKVGGGAVAGAVLGRVIGGSTKGAVVGGVVGAAVGTGVAIETADRDVVVPAGTPMVITVNETTVIR